MSNILVADDDPRQLKVRQLLLEAAGHHVRTALSTDAARKHLAATAPDLLLMDLTFPNAQGEPDASEGLALIRYTRANAPSLPVIVLSGWPRGLEGTPEAQMVARVLPKPCRTQVILDAIRELVPLLLCLAAVTGALPAETVRFRVKQRAEVVASVEMASPGSDWSKAGQEAALANLTVDGGKTQHVMLYAGERRHTYAAMLGMLEAGEHSLTIERNPQHSAVASGLVVHSTTFREVAPGDSDFATLANAPILYARADTIGQFSDVPLIAYCERVREDGANMLQYTVIFSNEDGGTSTRALMARWGRTTDIEYIYRGVLNAAGRVEPAMIQAKDHKDIPFDGVYEGTHPVLIPSTRNNMVSGQGTSALRYQLAPVIVDLSSHSREDAMDERPYSYRVMAQELVREGKLRNYGTVDGENISDPRNYVYVEVKMENRAAALGVVVRLKNENTWRASHLGRADYAMDRSGWARTTVELPPGTRPTDIAEIGFECVVPPTRPATLAGTCRVEEVGKAFFLNQEYRPGVGFFMLRESFSMPSGQTRLFPVVFPHVASR